MYALREALIAILRHPVSSFATLTTAAVSFTLLLLSGLFLWNLDRVVGTAERELQIAVFLVPEADLEKTSAEIERLPGVARIRPIPKQTALAELARDHPWVEEVAKIAGNPLPNTLIVSPSRAAAIPQLIAELHTIPGVESIEYGGRLTIELVRLARGVRLGTLALVFMLILNTFFSVMGTIRLSIESRRDELEVMQLVGATRGMILLPFVVEGFLLTLGAALIATAVAVPVYRYLSSELVHFYPFIPVLAPRDLLVATSGLLLLALVLGTTGGWLSSRARLKETV